MNHYKHWLKALITAISLAGLGSGLALPAFSESPPASSQPGVRPNQSRPLPTNPSSNRSPNAPADNANVGPADQNFILRAAQDGMAEVKLGQLALERGSSQSVKDYARHMIEEHTKVNQELAQVAEARGIALPQDVGPQHKATQQRLSRLSGASFDQAYMNAMVDSHRRAVSLFQNYSQQGKNQELTRWSSARLPNLQAHLQEARTLIAREFSRPTSVNPARPPANNNQ